MALGEILHVDGRVEAADVVGGSAEVNLGALRLIAKLAEGGVAADDACGDQLLVGHGGASGGNRGHGRFGNMDLFVERGEADEGGAHQQADGGDQRNEENAAENQPLVEAQHEGCSDRS